MGRLKKLYNLSYLFWLEIKRKTLGMKCFAEIDITDNCNLRCKHCYHFLGKKKFRIAELPLSVWEERFRKLHKSGVRFVLLVGGEPTLRNDVLMLADKIFPFVYIITNGTIKVPDEFNHRLFVSMDGSPDMNDSIRGKGVFSKIIKNYSGDNRVIINMTITKENYKDLEEVVKISTKNGFDGVVCNICTSGSVVELPMRIRRNERKPLIDELKRVKSKYPKNFLLSDAMIKWYEFPDHTDSCFWGDSVLHFDVSWKPRRCFADADCTNCGCLAGTFQSPLKMMRHPREMMKIL